LLIQATLSGAAFNPCTDGKFVGSMPVATLPLIWHFPQMAVPIKKQFRLSADEIQPLATGRGGAIATDRITVQGRPVGFMYRLAAEYEWDSGWVFTAGDESDAYMDDPDNFATYDVNVIANYDPDIIPLLDAPIGSAFIRTESGFVLDAEPARSE
jgi:hypothetical protein